MQIDTVTVYSKKTGEPTVINATELEAFLKKGEHVQTQPDKKPAPKS